MKVYYLDHLDCSGIFSSKEKAFESFMTCANRCGYTHIEKEDDPDGYSTISYIWYGFDGKPRSGAAEILEYELDEDNG